MRWVRPLVVGVVLAAMIALSGVVLGRIFADSLLAELVAGAAIGSVGVSVATRRMPGPTAAPISVLLLTGYTILALRIAATRAELTDPLPQIIRDSLLNGIPRLLTAMIPVEPTPDTVVVPVVAAWLAGLAGAELGVRAGRVLFGMAPALGLYAGALYVVGPNAGAAGWPTLAFAGLGIAGLAFSARPNRAGLDGVPAKTRAAMRGRALAGAAAGIAVLVGLVAVVGPWISGQVGTTPVDPRQYVQPPQVDSLDESPLNRISGWQLSPDQKLLEVGPATPALSKSKTVRIRLAVLPDYDGVTWRVGATYRNAGRVLPQEPRLADAAVKTVTQKITVDELTGRLLPVVPTPTSVTGARVAFDSGTGTLIRPEGLAKGLSYTVVSEVQTPDLNLLPSEQVPSGDAVARYLTLGPDVPEQIQRLADQLQENNGAAYDRASAIEDFLAEHYRKVADAPSGHAYPNLNFFLFGARNQGGQRGTSEQFAASFALLARLMGLPSRVVVGFNAPAAGGTVTGGDAIAWPEVLFDDLGWVAFDPMPKDNNPRPVEDDFTPKPTTPTTPPSDAPTASTAPTPSASATAAAVANKGGPSKVVVASGASGTLVFALAAAAFAIVVLRRGLRRRRLGEGTPDERITGAWREFTDALRLAGRPVPDHLAASEAAAFAATPPVPKKRLRRAVPEKAAQDGPADDSAHKGGDESTVGQEPAELPPLDELVAGINTVGFAPGQAEPGQAERAGQQVVAYAEALRAGRSWWRRLWWSVNPGPLRWEKNKHKQPSDSRETVSSGSK